MILYEFEGKKILSQNGIKIPRSEVLTDPSQKITLKPPFYIKAQVLSGKRKVAGGILKAENIEGVHAHLKELFSKEINDEKVHSVLIEEVVDFEKEYYLSLSYDSTYRSPVITFSESGGTGIEDRKALIVPISILDQTFSVEKFPKLVALLLPDLIKLFLDDDLLLLEINPLVESSNELIALDAKIKLDDTAAGKHKEWEYEPRSVAGHSPTKNEIEAKLIDKDDYHGTAGSTYFDLPGDIAVLASGGGASLTAMDALIAAGGKPANYTEYSGNPSKEKVEKLTKIVLSNENLNGLWVVGAIANFTDIYQTLSGFLDALRKVKPKPTYPILIRRGGPNDKEAFEMLKKVKDFDLHLYGEEISITQSAKIMTELAKKYAVTKKR